MHVTVIFEDKTIGVDGLFYVFDSVTPADANHRVIQWGGETGVIEVLEGDRVWLDDFAPVQAYLDQWTAHDDKVKAAAAAAAAAAEADANPPPQDPPNVAG